MCMNITNDIITKVMSLPSVGRKTAFKLLNSLLSPIKSDSDLIDFVLDNSKLLRTPLSYSEFQKAFDRANRIIEQSEMAGIKLVGYTDIDYPKLLKGIDDFPLLLSIKGQYKALNQLPSVAIIGTREPSDFGYKIGIRLGEVFGEDGFNVISGLAIGCDTAGHTGCLNKDGVTTAVLAHGLDSIYPKDNKQLAATILDKGGILISEYLIGQRPQANYFIERDRIQAGLSQAIIVVETDIKGGTMHTVKFAKNGKRIVAAFNHEPKYLSHPKTQGNQYLIRNDTAIPLSDTVSINNLKSTLLELSLHTFEKTVVELEPKLEALGGLSAHVEENVSNGRSNIIVEIELNEKKRKEKTSTLKTKPTSPIKTISNVEENTKKTPVPATKKVSKSKKSTTAFSRKKPTVVQLDVFQPQ